MYYTVLNVHEQKEKNQFINAVRLGWFLNVWYWMSRFTSFVRVFVHNSLQKKFAGGGGRAPTASRWLRSCLEER